MLKHNKTKTKVSIAFFAKMLLVATVTSQMMMSVLTAAQFPMDYQSPNDENNAERRVRVEAQARTIVRTSEKIDKNEELRDLAYYNEEYVCLIVRSSVDENENKRKKKLNPSEIARSVALGAPTRWAEIEECAQSVTASSIDLSDYFSDKEEGLSFGTRGGGSSSVSGGGATSGGGASSGSAGGFFVVAPGGGGSLVGLSDSLDGIGTNGSTSNTTGSDCESPSYMSSGSHNFLLSNGYTCEQISRLSQREAYEILVDLGHIDDGSNNNNGNNNNNNNFSGNGLSQDKINFLLSQGYSLDYINGLSNGDVENLLRTEGYYRPSWLTQAEWDALIAKGYSPDFIMGLNPTDGVDLLVSEGIRACTVNGVDDGVVACIISKGVYKCSQLQSMSSAEVIKIANDSGCPARPSYLTQEMIDFLKSQGYTDEYIYGLSEGELNNLLTTEGFYKPDWLTLDEWDQILAKGYTPETIMGLSPEDGNDLLVEEGIRPCPVPGVDSSVLACLTDSGAYTCSQLQAMTAGQILALAYANGCYTCDVAGVSETEMECLLGKGYTCEQIQRFQALGSLESLKESEECDDVSPSNSN